MLPIGWKRCLIRISRYAVSLMLVACGVAVACASANLSRFSQMHEAARELREHGATVHFFCDYSLKGEGLRRTLLPYAGVEFAYSVALPQTEITDSDLQHLNVLANPKLALDINDAVLTNGQLRLLSKMPIGEIVHEPQRM